MSTSIPAVPDRPSLHRRLGLLAARLALSAAVFAVCMVLAEGGVRLLGYQPIFSFYSKPSVFWRHDPLLGWSHTPNSRGTYVGPKPWPVEFSTPVEINSDGLRGPDVAPLPEHGRRVLFIRTTDLVQRLQVARRELGLEAAITKLPRLLRAYCDAAE